MSDSKSGRKPSVLDTKETFRHFSPLSTGQQHQKNDWYKSLYRFFNLRLADALDSTSLRNDHEVNKTIRNLRWCSSLALVSVDGLDEAKISATSKKCRSKFCYLCNRQRSRKLGSRLIKAIDEDLSGYDDYRFYFLTLTLKHDDTTRNYDYLSELKEYQNKLFKSKVWRSIFGSDDGIIQSFENSMIKGMHIHSHNMIFAPRLRKPVAECERLIREKWLKLTKDSSQIRLDLIGKNLKEDQESFIKPVLELFKYSTKMSFKKGDMFSNERLAEWVMTSKGKNFINARGEFRGLQLTSYKSRLDEKAEPQEYDESLQYYFERTAKIKHNYSTRKDYDIEQRNELLGKVAITSITDRWRVEKTSDELMTLLQLGFDDNDLDRIVTESIAQEKTIAQDLDKHLSFNPIIRPRFMQTEFEFGLNVSFDHY